jgi:hypothetical protein
MDSLLDQNKKIFGNLAKIVNKNARKEECVSTDHYLTERDYLIRMNNRNRINSLMTLEKNNIKMAQKIASA